MHGSTDIRAQIEADKRLQREICASLLGLAETLDNRLDLRLARVLSRTLEVSWAEHVSFQEDAMFPILTAHHGNRLQSMMDARHSEHSRLAQLHDQIGRRLNGLLATGNMAAGNLQTYLREACALRMSHLAFDADLEDELPAVFTDDEIRLFASWSEARPALRFPINLLRTGIVPSGGRTH
ncbi:MAG: hypothetical protein WC829_05395 [Hyphomicrobium sp.]